MADAADSKSVGRKAVWVRLPPPAPEFLSFCVGFRGGMADAADSDKIRALTGKLAMQNCSNSGET